MSNQLKPLLVILGSTASGKSDLSQKIAKKYKGEIISADSRQIYKEMDIGTAKTSASRCEALRTGKSACNAGTSIAGKQNIHLIDIVRPNQKFSLAQYQRMAIAKINQIHKKGKLPILVGGTGLYIQSVVDNLQIPHVPPNPKLRKKLEADIKKYGLTKIYQRLLKLDPQAAKFVQSQNPRRIIRALEVCLISKKPFSASRRKGKILFDTLQIGMKLNEKELKQKIDRRVEQMFRLGLVSEVKTLIKKYPHNLPAFSGIGYQEVIKYLHKEISLQQAKDLIKLHTLQYAKRQIVWFKKDPRIRWVKDFKQAQKLIVNSLHSPQ